MPETDGFTRSDLSGQGIRRVRCGRGFRYLDPESHRPDAATLARIKALVIPPARQDVWICPDPCGHIQATGTDSAGRRQYVYHESWRRRREADKHDRMLCFAAALPRIRKAVGEHLAGEKVSRSKFSYTAKGSWSQSAVRLCAPAAPYAAASTPAFTSQNNPSITGTPVSANIR